MLLHQFNAIDLLASVMDFLHKTDVATFGIMSSKSKIIIQLKFLFIKFIWSKFCNIQHIENT